MTDATQAAERLRRHTLVYQPDQYDAVADLIDDLTTVARAYLSEHAADDGEAIDEAWLDQHYTEYREWLARCKRYSIGVVRVLAYDTGSVSVFAVGSNELPITTRGQLKLLLRALGGES